MRDQGVKQTTLMSIDRVTNRKWFSSDRERTVTTVLDISEALVNLLNLII